MVKTYKTLICSFVIILFNVGFVSAEQPKTKLDVDTYCDTLKTYIKNDNFEKIKETGFINLNAIRKGTNLGYLKPRIEKIQNSKNHVDEFITKIEKVEFDNPEMQNLNNEILSRLNDMSSNLNNSIDKHKEVLNYTDSYLDKVIHLKTASLLTGQGSSNSSLSKYNTNLKEIKKVYKDIKNINRVHMSVSDLL